MGFLSAIGRALVGAAKRVSNWRAARQARKTPTTPKTSTPPSIPKTPKTPNITALETSLERDLAARPYMSKRQADIFYSQTKRFWQGLPNEMRDRAIVEGLGVDSLEDAYELVMQDARNKLRGKLPENWESLTDDERYDYIMSLLSFR